MLTIDMSALSRTELQRLLESARARNQAALEERILAELKSRTSREPRPMAAPKPVARPTRSAPRSRAGAVTAGLAAAVAAIVVLGWGLSANLPQLTGSGAPAPAPGPARRASVALVNLSEAPAPPLEASPQSDLPIVPPLTATPRKSSSNPCYDKPTPAERLVCGYPTLANRDRDLKAAYARALEAGADPVVLATAQAAWRARSARIQEWPALAQSYDEQIRELENAAATPPAQVGNP